MVVIRGVIVRFIVVRIHLCSHPVEHSGPSTLKQDFRVIQKFLPFLVGYHPVRKVWNFGSHQNIHRRLSLQMTIHRTMLCATEIWNAS
jgi:hypothetical protein